MPSQQNSISILDRVIDQVKDLDDIFDLYVRFCDKKDMTGYTLVGKLALFVEVLFKDERLRDKFFKDHNIVSSENNSGDDKHGEL